MHPASVTQTRSKSASIMLHRVHLLALLLVVSSPLGATIILMANGEQIEESFSSFQSSRQVGNGPVHIRQQQSFHQSGVHRHQEFAGREPVVNQNLGTRESSSSTFGKRESSFQNFGQRDPNFQSFSQHETSFLTSSRRNPNIQGIRQFDHKPNNFQSVQTFQQRRQPVAQTGQQVNASGRIISVNVLSGLQMADMIRAFRE